MPAVRLPKPVPGGLSQYQLFSREELSSAYR